MAMIMQDAAKIFLGLLEAGDDIFEYSDKPNIWTDFLKDINGPDLLETCNFIRENNFDRFMSYEAKKKFALVKRYIWKTRYTEIDVRPKFIYNGLEIGDDIKRSALLIMKQYNIPETQPMFRYTIKYILALREAEG